MRRITAKALCAITCAVAVTGCGFGSNTNENDERIDKLEKKIDKYEKRIDELEEQVEQLEGENDRLKSENEELQDELESILESGYESGSGDGFYAPYMIYTDEYGNTIDLGGMEITVRDWWSNPDERYNVTNAYEEAQADYWDWLELTYNFTLKRVAISDWTDVGEDYYEYVKSGGDDNNYIFVLRDCDAVTSAASEGLMYDLNTLDCIDFTYPQYTLNMNFETYSKLDSIYSMASGHNDAGIGVYFNKKLLDEAGINYELIYEMQQNKEWNWDAFLDLVNKSQRDINNDGVAEIFGLAVNTATMTRAAVYSNGGQFIGKNGQGYTCEVESVNTLDALEWVDNIYDWYVEDYTDWMGYQNAFINSQAAFLVDYAYIGCEGGWLYNSIDLLDGADNIGFVAFPSGPAVHDGDYCNYSLINPVVIPACYDIDRAWSLAFVWNLWNRLAPGYEDYIGGMERYSYNCIFGDRDIESILLMKTGRQAAEHSLMIPGIDLSSQLLWNISGNGNAADMAERAADEWEVYIDAANR